MNLNFSGEGPQQIILPMMITEFYVITWTWLCGAREYLSNWFDACFEKHPQHQIIKKKVQGNKTTFVQSNAQGEEKPNYIEYDAIERTLTLVNDKAFDIKCLLIGCSFKPAQTVGMFGEGMKIAMIALLRQGFRIKIRSGSKTYQPILQTWGFAHPMFAGKYTATNSMGVEE